MAKTFRDFVLETIGKHKTPAEAYIAYLEFRRKDPDSADAPALSYISHSISTGGFVRDRELSKYEAIQHNVNLVRELVEILYKEKTLHKGKSAYVLPLDFEHIEGWTAFEYMCFWSFIIAGVENPEDVVTLEKFLRVSTNLEIFNGKSLEPEDVKKRQDTYRDFTLNIFDAIKLAGIKCSPVEQLIQVLDNDLSSGCLAEDLLARLLDIPVLRVYIPDHEHSDLASVAGYLKRLEELGSDFFRNSQGREVEMNGSTIVLLEM